MNKIKYNYSWKSVKNIVGLLLFLLLTIYFTVLLGIKKNTVILYLLNSVMLMV